MSKVDSDPGFDPRPGSAFSWRTRVYWEDTDAGGVVYHAAYLRFMERARTEWMRAAVAGQEDIRRSHRIVFVVRGLEIDYDKPARLDDELDVGVRVLQLRTASVVLAQAVLRAADAVTLARARVRVACVDATTFVPCRIPVEISALMQGNHLQ